MRALLAPVAPMHQVELAEAVGSSQASVSNALRALAPLVSPQMMDGSRQTLKAFGNVSL